jgi:Flp pilus assembly protein TadG
MSRFLLRAGRTVKRAEGGQSLIEFAIVLPVLLALVIGIFEFGRAWNVYQVITNAAREGARTAVVPTTESEDAVYAVIQNYFDRSALDGDLGTVTVDGFQSGVGQPLTVEIQYPYEFQFLGPIVAFLGDGSGTTPGSITLSTTAVMRNE